MFQSEELVQAKRRLSNFVEEMREFPCSFNLGDATILDVGTPLNISRPILKDDVWLFLKKHLSEDDDDDDEKVHFVWRQNVLVRVHAELHNVRKSLKFCTDLVHTLPDNLVAHANLAFVYLLKGDMSMAETQLSLIKERKFSDDAQLDAVAEQCYTYFKISGDDQNLISATELIKYVLRFRPKDDRLRLMLAVLYRRLSRFKKYLGRDQSVYRKDCVAKAVQELLRVRRTESSSSQIKALAVVELALLKNGQKLFDEWEKARLMGEESVVDLCTLAISLSPTSTRVLTTVGQILLSLHEFRKAEEIVIQVLENRTCSRAYIYLGWVYTNKAIEIDVKRGFQDSGRGAADLRKIVLKKHEVQLIKLLTYVTDNIKFLSDNDAIRKALNIFKTCVKMDYCEAEMLRKIAFKFMQRRDYTTALVVCEKLVREDRSCAEQTTCHSVMCHMAAICCSQMAFTIQDETEQHMLYSKARDMILASVRVMASLVLRQTHLKTPSDLWRCFCQTPRIQEMKIENLTESNFESLIKLVAYYKEAVPVLRALVDKPEDTWLDIGSLERELTYWKVQGLTKALLYLDFIKLKGDKACQLTWQNSSVVRSIKLDVAKKVLRHHQADDNPDPIWQEIFNEEYELAPQLKWAPLCRLDALLELKTYDVVIVGTGDELTRQVVECLKDIFGQVLGMIVLDVAQLPSLEQQMVVSSSAQVVIFVMNVNTPRKLADETRQPTQPIEPTKQSSRSKQPMETFENSRSNLTIEESSESSQSSHLMEPSNHNSQLNQNIKPCIERRQSKQIIESSDQSSKANQLTELSNQSSQSKQPFEPSNESSQSKQPTQPSNESSQSKQPFETSNASSESSEPIQPDAEKVDLNSRFVAIRHSCLNSYDLGNSPKQLLNLFTGPFSTQGSPRELIGHQSLHLTCNDLKVMSFMSPGVNRFESNFSDDIPTSLTGGSVNDRTISNVTGGSANDRPISNVTGVSANDRPISNVTGVSANDRPIYNVTGALSNATPDLIIHKIDSKVNNDASVEVVMKIFKGIVRQLPYDI